MKIILSFFVVVLALANASAADLKVSPTEPIMITAVSEWSPATRTGPTDRSPYATVSLAPAEERNALCMVSVLDKNRPEFKDPEFLKKVLRGDSRPYLSSPEEAKTMEIKPFSIQGGLGFYANFIDPDLVDKPVKKGNYKTATPLILSIGSDYLIKFTILCDDLKGKDYSEALQMVKSIRINKPAI